MRLDSGRVFGFRKNFEQFVIGEEVKSWESCSFDFKIIIQTFLDTIEGVLAFFEGLQKGSVFGEVDDFGILNNFGHHLFPVSIDITEIIGLHR